MRFAILSDIHGNLPALEATLADVASQGADEILIAGDLVSACPYPRETLDLIRSLNCPCIRGNNETYHLNLHNRNCLPDVLTNLQWGATRWAYQQLRPTDLDWIAALPTYLSLDTPGGGIRVVHGALENENVATAPDRDPQVIAQLEQVHLLKPGQTIQPLADILASISEQVLVSGHIHIPWLQREGQKLGLNPGSTGMPINGDPRSQYALLTWDGRAWQVVFRQVEYDRARTQRAFASSGLLQAGSGFARACMLDLNRAQNTTWEFVRHASATASARGVTSAIIPDDIWTDAVATFNWDEPPTR